MKKLKEIIIKKLKENSFYNFGYYIRLYPDSLEKTRGYFEIEIKEYIDFNTFRLIECTFDIVSVEGDFRNNGNLDFYEKFNTLEDLYEFVNVFLDRFKHLKDLGNYVYSKFHFLKPKDPVIDAYFLMKNDLEDGTTFEDFFDGVKGRS